MYTIVRRIHLYASTVLLSFVLMYFITGYVMTHEQWFPRRPPPPVVTKQVWAYRATDLPENDPLAAAAFVKKAFALPGQINPQSTAPVKTGGTWQIRIGHPGAAYVVTITPRPFSTSRPSDGFVHADVAIASTDFNAAGTMNGFHRLRSFGGGMLYDVWAVFYDAAAIALIIFALTGVYLWWKLSKIRWPGVVVLLIGMGFTVGTIVYLAVAP